MGCNLPTTLSSDNTVHLSWLSLTTLTGPEREREREGQRQRERERERERERGGERGGRGGGREFRRIHLQLSFGTNISGIFLAIHYIKVKS